MSVKYTKHDIDIINDLYSKGKTPTEVSKITGKDRHAIVRTLKKLTVYVRPVRVNKEERIGEIVNGMKITEITGKNELNSSALYVFTVDILCVTALIGN